MNCTKCGNQNNDDVKFCRHCGESIQKKTCSNGHNIPPGLTSCPYCPQNRAATVAEPAGTAAAAPPVGGGGAPPRRRQGTVVVSGDELPGPGGSAGGGGGMGMAAPSGRAPAPASQGKRRSGTVFMDPDAPTGGPGGPGGGGAAAAGSVSVPGMTLQTGASPLAGFLVSTTLDKNGVFWPLRIGRCRLGADAEEVDVCIPHGEISGKHAVIMLRESKGELRIWCKDTESQNGTIVNGDEIFNQEIPLGHGDVIKLGPVELQLILLP